MKSLYIILIGGILVFGLSSCSAEKSDNNASTSEKSVTDPPGVVEVTAVYDAENDQHLFQTDTDTIPAGWTTFKFTNTSPMVHFLFFDYLPEGKNSEDMKKEVSPVFQESSYLIMEGKSEEAMAAFSKLPEWFSQVVFRGGPGFVSPGYSTEATLFMKPGNYAMECYIKTADGTFHWKKGMMEDLRVTSDTTSVKPPQSPTVEITTTDKGLEIDGTPTVGKHLVKVTFNEENPSMIGRDVHVARLGEYDSIDEIITWLDFNNAKGMVSTAEKTGPTTFIGGTHEMPMGNTAYFKVQFEEGRYAWVSEQPVNKSTVYEFTVSAAPGE